MKNRFTTIVAVLLASLVVSCGEDTPPVTGTPVAPAGTMIALLNGASFASENGIETSWADLDTSSNRQLTIVGRKGGNEELAVTINSVRGSATYTLGGAQPQGLGSYARFDFVDTTQTRTYGTTVSQSGSITISKFDTVGSKVSGFFRFTGLQLAPPGTTNTMKVLDGSFTDLPLKRH